MTVRIQLKHGPEIRPRDPHKVTVEEMAGGLAVLLQPFDVLAAVMTLWRLGADTHFTGPFFVQTGLWSHWQVWFTLAGVLRLAVFLLKRRARLQLISQSNRSSKPMGMPGGASRALGTATDFGSFSN